MTRSVGSMFELTGRVALVTGGAGRLGRVLAHTLAELGAAVAVVDLDRASVDALATELSDDHGVPALGLVADLASASAPSAVVEDAVANLGGLDILVNNAALTGSSTLTGYAAPLADQSDEAFDLAVAVNLRAPFSLVRAARVHLASRGFGSVVNVSSIYGLLGPVPDLYADTQMATPAAYAASKGGLVQLTRFLATSLAPAIRVNAIAPGGLLRGQDAGFVQRYVQRTPLQRMGSEDDIRGVLAWLAGDAAGYVTGQVVAVDGGWSAW